MERIDPFTTGMAGTFSSVGVDRALPLFSLAALRNITASPPPLFFLLNQFLFFHFFFFQWSRSTMSSPPNKKSRTTPLSSRNKNDDASLHGVARTQRAIRPPPCRPWPGPSPINPQVAQPFL